MNSPLKITKDELIGEPMAHSLATGKTVMVFNFKLSDKTNSLTTGNRIYYQNEVFELLNRQVVQATKTYTKFNCIRTEITVNTRVT